MTVGSLFSGYGGLDDAACKMFDAEVAWVSDIEDGPCRILERVHPNVPNIGNIVDVNWRSVPKVDIITGGSPCQDISAAGRQAGMSEGTRSNLWVQMRLGISIIKPKYVIWENVLGALSAKADSDMEQIAGLLDQQFLEEEPPKEDRPLRALGRVLGDLAEIGYDAEWEVVSASDAGAPHQRKRVFVLAWPAEDSVRS